MITPIINQKAKRRRCMAIHNVQDKIHRNHAKDIVNNPAIFSADDKINTFLSFHKDTCVNILLLLYPSIDDEDGWTYDDAFNDLEILKSFKPVLLGCESEFQRNYLDACYWYLRANKRLLQAKAEMSAFLKSSDSLLEEDIKNMMLQILGCDDDYYSDDDYDEERRIRSLESQKQDALGMLKMLEVDMSKYQQDSDGDPKFIDDQPTQATINQYTLLEDEVTRTHNEMTELFENAHPIASYLSIVKHHVQDMEGDLSRLTIANFRRRIKMHRRKMKRQKLLKKILRKATCRSRRFIWKTVAGGRPAH
ncbi:hypothetical protein MKW92_013651 [Papaver armeniacum]|nr:hypothetical protein MKW92_013651 [Papaver armeniacum]